MDVVGYEVDSRRVYTGNTKTFGAKDGIPSNYITTEPPESEHYKIWDGTKWFLREEYPTPPNPEPEVNWKITKLSFRSRLTLQEKVAIEDASETNSTVRVIKGDLDSATFIDLKNETVVEGLSFLVTEGILTEERKEEILNTVPEESELYVG